MPAGKGHERHRRKQEAIYQRMKVAELYLAGKMQTEIAADLGISQPTVSRDLKWLTKQWIKDAIVDFDAARARELAKINRLEMEYWDAWRKSCEVHTEKQLDEKQAGKGTEKRKQMKTITRTGNPAFLAGVERCIDKRCELLGLKSWGTVNVRKPGADGSEETTTKKVQPLLVLNGVSWDDL